MKLRYIPYWEIGYLIVLFLGYIAEGYLLAAYNVNQLILLGNYFITLRLAQTGSSSISLAIAWISIWIWVGVFVWAKPMIIGAANVQIVAFFLLSSWIIATSLTFLLAFAKARIYKLGINKHNSSYGLIILVWGAMTIGWHVYQWTNP